MEVVPFCMDNGFKKKNTVTFSHHLVYKMVFLSYKNVGVGTVISSQPNLSLQQALS